MINIIISFRGASIKKILIEAFTIKAISTNMGQERTMRLYYREVEAPNVKRRKI